jgi:hypothetical protein
MDRAASNVGGMPLDFGARSGIERRRGAGAMPPEASPVTAPAWLQRQCCRVVIFAMFIWIYRCLEAAGAIEDLDAAVACHFTEWLPRNIVVAP